MNNRQNRWRVMIEHAGHARMGSVRVGMALLSAAAAALGVHTAARAQSDARAISAESALELMQHGDCAGATAQLEALRRTSKDGKYLAALTGSFLLDSGDSAGALLVFRTAISLSPT